MKKRIAEALGTLILVFFGCGSAVLMGAQIGMPGISLAFGLSIVAAAYGLGAISGAHLNPAVSLGMVAAGRMSFGAFISYAIAPIIGAIAASAVILMIASGKADYVLATNGLGQNGYGAGYLGEYTMSAAVIFEAVATFLFVTVILGATETGAPSAMAGLAIGLTLAAIHLVGINVTGVSVNPARSIGPALMVGGKAMSDLWLFILAPLAGGFLAGVIYAAGLTKATAEAWQPEGGAEHHRPPQILLENIPPGGVMSARKFPGGGLQRRPPGPWPGWAGSGWAGPGWAGLGRAAPSVPRQKPYPIRCCDLPPVSS